MYWPYWFHLSWGRTLRHETCTCRDKPNGKFVHSKTLPNELKGLWTSMANAKLYKMVNIAGAQIFSASRRIFTTGNECPTTRGEVERR